MKINRDPDCIKPKLMLRDLKPGDVFEKDCHSPAAVYLVLDYSSKHSMSAQVEAMRSQGRYPLADLTNNRALPKDYYERELAVRKLDVELCVKGEQP